MFTVSMAVGSIQLTRKGALVTRLSASEDAASMDVLCVDKTGTLTRNRLAIARTLPWDGFTERDVVLYGALASQEANRDPIDRAFLAAASEQGAHPESFAVEGFTPFDPESRRTEACVNLDGASFRVMKGAPLSIAKACAVPGSVTEQVAAQEEELSQGGRRVLAVARIETEGNARIVGLVSLQDPLRPDSKELVRELRGLGVAVKMLTGDALPVARQVTDEVGLVGQVQRASDLERLVVEDAARAAEAAEQSAGFAEIYPEGKYAVVKALQKKGHVVGMTGDGVNDAPALRQAEVGIAVSTAVDVAKGAASVVLTTEGLSSIIELARTGRMIHERITTWIVNKISRTVLTSGFTVLAFLITGSYVVSAFGLILMVVVTDFGKIALSTDNVRWSERPVRWNLGGWVKLSVGIGVLMLVESLAFFFAGSKVFHLEGNLPALQTFTFEILFYFAIFSPLSVRERGHFWHSRPSRTLIATLGVEGLVSGIFATVGMPGLTALPIAQTLCVIGYSFAAALVLNDWAKVGLMKALGMRPTRQVDRRDPSRIGFVDRRRGGT
jgi:H+-transporting ATPase